MTVYLVGAGPGDPGLLTCRGAELLARADCVLYDRLVGTELLDLITSNAERIFVGKEPGRPELPQDDINELLVQRGQKFDVVVRLKGGDPFLFGRGGEEAEVLRAADIPFEIVPGVTSAISAPAYAGIPVTHRGVSTHVTIVTGHEDPTKREESVDWRALARSGGTLVILMGIGNRAEIAMELMAGGLDSKTPVAIVQNGTLPTQKSLRVTLDELGNAQVSSPAIIVVGTAAALDFAWFEKRPLFGKAIAVTRAREQASELKQMLGELGAQVFELPAIQIEPLAFDLPDLKEFSWIVFTSANGVRHFFERVLVSRDSRALASAQIAVIGSGTEDALRSYGLRADLVPERFVAESLVEAFPRASSGDRVLIARAEQARDALPEGLRELGYALKVLPVYRTTLGEPDPVQVDAVRDGKVDAITFTSSSTVENLTELLGEVPNPQPLAVSIGPITSNRARELGWRIDAEAPQHTIPSLVETVKLAVSNVRR